MEGQHLNKGTSECASLVKRLELKDQYTYNHSVRVQDYSLRIGKKLQLSIDRLKDLSYAALLHDIGKIYVPDEILNKKGKLSLREMEILKKHATDGCEIVKETSLSSISEIILQHHERIDGTGYPSGLKENEIVLESQIIAVADTFDAMTTKRVYREARGPQVAIDEIKKRNNRHFSKKIVDAFERVLIIDGILPESQANARFPS